MNIFRFRFCQFSNCCVLFSMIFFSLLWMIFHYSLQRGVLRQTLFPSMRACKAGWTGPRCTKGTFIKFPIFYCAIFAPVTFARQKAQLTIVLNISEISLVSAIFFKISHFILLPVCRFEKLDTNGCGHYINVALQICLSIISMRVYRQNLL